MLKGKKVIVTGGSSGLGQAMCKIFAREGAWIAFNYSSNENGADKTVEQIKKYTDKVKCFKASVLDKKLLKEIVEDLEEEWDGIDVLVNNAGISQILPIALLEEEDWDRVMDVNVKGTYLVSRTVLKGMIRRRRGKILNMGSLAGMRIIEAPVHYAASKAAIKGFTESLAKELGRYNITVNSLAPGMLEGGVGANLPSYRLKDYLKHCSLGRVGNFSEVSEMAAFLISDDNTYMNGLTIVMDGGL